MFCISAEVKRDMPRSPTSSEDEMAQSVSDYSQESGSESSKQEAIYETLRTVRPVSRMMDIQSHSLDIRVNIPDLQQTVSVCVCMHVSVCVCVCVCACM